MDESYKTEWLKRLRSGDWRQGRGNLCSLGHGETPNSFCCLGVLTEIAVERGEAERVVAPGSEVVYYRFSRGDEMSGEYAGTIDFDFGNRIGVDTSTTDHLIGMNDGGDGFVNNPQTFDQIADWIESNL